MRHISNRLTKLVVSYFAMIEAFGNFCICLVVSYFAMIEAFGNFYVRVFKAIVTSIKTVIKYSLLIILFILTGIAYIIYLKAFERIIKRLDAFHPMETIQKVRAKNRIYCHIRGNVS